MKILKKIKFNFLLIVVIIISVIFCKYFYRPVIISGSSMEPTFYDGQLAFTNVINKNDINRFDVVCINTNSKYIIKRVIGLPGDNVRYVNNVLYINNIKYDEPFLHQNTYTTDLNVNLNDDEYFCLGDNREHSKDSRFYGNFKLENILSKDIYKISFLFD